MVETLVEAIALPQGTQAEVSGSTVTVRSGGKQNSKKFQFSDIVIKKNGENIEVHISKHRRDTAAQARTVAGIITGLVGGLSKNYEYKLEIVYSHFPLNVSVKGDNVEIYNLGGAKHPRKAKIVGDTKVEIKGKDITVKGTNKEHSGQTAANMVQATKIKGGKDVRVFQDGIYVVVRPSSKK